MTWEIANQNKHIVWNYAYLTTFDDVSLNVIEDNLDKGWDYYYLSTSNKITKEFVLKYPNLPWKPELHSHFN